MSFQRNRSVVLVLSVLAMALVAEISRHQFQAQTQPPSSARVRWEYCMVDEIRGGDGWKASVHYGSGTAQTIETDYTGIGAVNRLGLEGWEVVSVLPLARDNSVEYFLKRPVR